MQRGLTYLLSKLGRFYLAINALMGLFVNVVAVALAMLALKFYIDVSHAELLRIFVLAEGLAILVVILAAHKVYPRIRVIKEWLKGKRDAAQTVEAWRAAVGLPFHVIRTMYYAPLSIVPWTVVTSLYLKLGPAEAAGLLLGAAVLVGYIAILRYFQIEIVMRPVVTQIAASLPAEVRGAPPVVSLRWKLLAGIPLINIITGVVVSGISAPGRVGLLGLGVDVLVAVAVAFTISLELSMLLSRSILLPVRELLTGAEKISHGHYNVRVPVTSNDEIGELTRGFNEMARGLAERERLRDALGSYVDPDVAERILSEGELLAGEEVEVTILFFDVRGFTEKAGSLLPREAVSLLNGLFELAVPILHKHGGHSVKFVGDGGMAVFGVPDLHVDHADRALAAAGELVDAVKEEFKGELEVGVGINSGRVLVGSVGGGGRLEFTAIGDAVNVASRVERQTRETGDAILVTEATKDLLDKPDGLTPRPSAALKGRTEPVPLYAPTDHAAVAEEAATRRRRRSRKTAVRR